jgi:signal transduction histidine kinase
LLAVSSDEPGPARDVGLNDVVRRLQPGLAELLPAGATLELDLDDAPVVRAPTTTVERAVVDLFLHARDAIDSGGTIRIVTSSAAEDEAPADLPRGRYARLVVEDDGAGMDDDTRDRALERFFFTTKAIGSGPGLGLSAVYGILRRIGGSVEIDAAPGQGTRIVTVWPSPKAGC